MHGAPIDSRMKSKINRWVLSDKYLLKNPHGGPFYCHNTHLSSSWWKFKHSISSWWVPFFNPDFSYLYLNSKNTNPNSGSENSEKLKFHIRDKNYFCGLVIIFRSQTIGFKSYLSPNASDWVISFTTERMCCM